MGCQVKEVVHCHAGWHYPEHPLSFFWDSDWVKVDKVLNEWKTPDGVVYIVRTQKNKQFKLFYCIERDSWSIVAI